MPQAVYTRSFGYVRGTSGQLLTMMTIPDYDTFVIRDVVFFYADPAAKYLQLAVLVGGVNIPLFSTTLTGQATIRQELRQVLPGGGILRATADHGSWSCMATGYHLIGRAPAVSQPLPAEQLLDDRQDLEGGAPLWSFG